MSRDRDALHAQFDRLLDALDAEKAAKDAKGLSVEERFKPQEAAIALMHALQRDTGLQDLLQRRLVVEVRGCRNGTPVPATALPTKREDYLDEAGQRKLRSIIRRMVLDSGTLPQHAVELAAADLLFASEGYEMTGALGVLSAPVPRPGRNRMAGLDEALRLSLVVRLGYTAGYDGLPTTGRLTKAMVARAQEWVRQEFTRRGLSVVGHVPSRAALRLWTGNTKKDVYEDCYRAGCADRAAGAKPAEGSYLPS